MAVRYTEYWGTISANRSDLLKMISAQDTAYKAFRDQSSESQISSALTGFGIAILSAIFKKNTIGLVAGTLYAMVGAIDAQGRIDNANKIFYGKTVLSEINDVLTSKSTYTKIEATVFFREFTNTATGAKISSIVGNSSTKGKNSGAYQIKRIQLSNGNWITQ